MDYKLDKDELAMVTTILYIRISKNKEEWDTKIFDKLLKKDPSLIPVYEEFIKNISRDNFVKQFADKISLKNIYNFLFHEHSSFFHDIKKKLMERLHEKTTDLFPTINPNKDIFSANIYLDFIKKMPLKEGMVGIYALDDMVEKIKSIKNEGDIPLAKKKILNLYRILPKNQKSYETIKSCLSAHLIQSVAVNQYLEEKLKKYPPEILRNHQANREEKVSMSEEELRYSYNITIKTDWLLENMGLKIQAANSFLDRYYNTLRLVLSQREMKYPDVITEQTANKMSFDCNSIENRDKVKFYVSLISANLVSLSSGLDLKNSAVDIQKELMDNINRFLMSHELETSLPQKEVSPKKNKI